MKSRSVGPGTRPGRRNLLDQKDRGVLSSGSQGALDRLILSTSKEGVQGVDRGRSVTKPMDPGVSDQDPRRIRGRGSSDRKGFHVVQ